MKHAVGGAALGVVLTILKFVDREAAKAEPNSAVMVMAFFCAIAAWGLLP